MNLNEYQDQAMSTCMPSCKNETYMMWNLMSEVGEFAGKVAKHVRHGNATIDQDRLVFRADKVDEFDYHKYMNELMLEAGDILWQVAGLCEVMGWSLDAVAQANLDKLASRKQRGVIDGNGDNR